MLESGKLPASGAMGKETGEFDFLRARRLPLCTPAPEAGAAGFFRAAFAPLATEVVWGLGPEN